MSSSEKRAITRYQVEIDLQVVCNGEAMTARSLNMGIGGALVRVEASTPLRVGQRVEVSFHVPDLAAPLKASADVRWIGELDVSLVGLQFVTGFRAKETWALGRFLDRQMPI